MSCLDKFLQCNEIDSIDQTSAIDEACKTEDPETLVKILDKFPKMTDCFHYTKGSFKGPTSLLLWDAIGRATTDFENPAHSAKMASVIISHPLFTCEGESMYFGLRSCYGSDLAIWAAVVSIPNLPQGVRDRLQ